MGQVGKSVPGTRRVGYVLLAAVWVGCALSQGGCKPAPDEQGGMQGDHDAANAGPSDSGHIADSGEPADTQSAEPADSGEPADTQSAEPADASLDASAPDTAVSGEGDAQTDAGGGIETGTVADAAASDGGEATGPPGFRCDWGFKLAYELSFDAGNTLGPGVASADLNGDGKADLAWIPMTGGVSVLLGHGDGTFQPPVNYETDSQPSGVVIGDVNDDGKPDLVVYTGAFDILLGNGDGTFRPYVAYRGVPGTSVDGYSSTGVAIADVNGDGKEDLVAAIHSSDASGDITVLLGNGDGTFQAATSTSVDAFPTGLAVADLNGDGKVDLVLTEFGSLTVRLGNGNGTFQSPATWPANSPGGPAVADVNRDGKPDIAFVDQQSNIAGILLGNGDGTFQPEVTYPTGAFPSLLSLADVDRNGSLDLVVFNWGSGTNANDPGDTLSVLLGNGDGTFQTQETFSAGVDDVQGGGGMALGDFNGDGYIDVACPILEPRGTGPVFAILLGDHRGLFHSTATAAAPAPSSVAAGDLNGDGKPDLVVANAPVASSNLDVSVLIGKGDGTFQPQVSYAAGTNSDSLGLADLNGDGKLDVAVANAASGTVSVLLGGGDGTLRTQVTYPVGASPTFVAVGDLNRDGNPDLVVANGPVGGDAGAPVGSVDTVSVLLGMGDGTFEPQATYPTGDGPTSLALADVNGDGTLDVAVTNETSNRVGVLLGNGDGTLRTQVTYATVSEPVSVAAGDLNGDGKPDLAVANFGANSISLFLGVGDGTFQSQTPYSTGTVLSTPTALAIADVDGDGTPDLVATDPGEASFDILLGHGDGSFDWPIVYATGTNPDSLALSDFNRDGRIDVAVGNGASDNISVLLGACTAAELFGADAGATDSGSVASGGDGLISVFPTSLSFEITCAIDGEPGASSMAPSLPVTITNSGSSPVTYRISPSDETLSLSPGASYVSYPWFSIDVIEATPGVLIPGQSATVTVTPSFLVASPPAQELQGSVVITTGGDAGTTQTVSLEETVGGGYVISLPSNIAFGNVPIGTTATQFISRPPNNLPGLALSHSQDPNGYDPMAAFQLSGSAGQGGWTLTFTPHSVGTQTESLAFFSEAGDAICLPNTLTATGTGVPNDGGAGSDAGDSPASE